MEDSSLFLNESVNWIKECRLTIIVGHFGTGKTEVAVNMALALGSEKIPFTFADLDVVDPYFRSRECSDLIVKAGGRVITSSQECMDADVPSIPADTASVFDDKNRYAIMDIGGDPSGARVLAQFRGKLGDEKIRVLCILNANRPFTSSKEKMISYIRNIEAAGCLKINGLINNTHTCNETTVEDIAYGARMAREVAEETGIPLYMHSADKRILSEIESNDPGKVREILGIEKNEIIFPIDIFMKKPWE